MPRLISDLCFVAAILFGVVCVAQAQFNSFPPGVFTGRAALDPGSGGGGSCGASTLTVDGHNNAAISTASSGNIAITTTSTNDVIVVDTAIEVNSATAAPSITVSGGTGIGAWTRRSGFPFASTSVAVGGNTTFGTAVDRWWATASGTLAAASITVTFGATIDDASVVVYGVNGARTSAPFDANVSLPFLTQNNNTGAVVTTTSSVSTTCTTHTMVLGTIGNFKGGGVGGALLTAATGYTSIDGNANNGATNNSLVQTEEQVFSGAQTNLAVGFVESRQGWYMIGDAIQAGP